MTRSFYIRRFKILVRFMRAYWVSCAAGKRRAGLRYDTESIATSNWTWERHRYFFRYHFVQRSVNGAITRGVSE